MAVDNHACFSGLLNQFFDERLRAASGRLVQDLSHCRITRGVARNLLRGVSKKLFSVDPQRGPGAEPGGDLGRSSQKPETNFQLRRMDMHPCPPHDYATAYHLHSCESYAL